MKVSSLLKSLGLVSVDESPEETMASENTSATVNDDKPPAAAKASAKTSAANLKPVSEATQTVDAEQVATSVEASGIGELSISFAEIFKALKISTPAHGWDVDKVLTAISTPQFKAIDAATAKAAMQAMLAASGVPPEDIVQDAVGRDKALDAYEEYAAKKLAERLATHTQDVQTLQKQIAQCETEIARVKTSMTQAEEAFKAWQVKKAEKEEELVKVVSMLTAESKISVSNLNKS